VQNTSALALKNSVMPALIFRCGSIPDRIFYLGQCAKIVMCLHEILKIALL
jgi:hypothetical protein